MHVRNRWAQLHVYIVIVSFVILWCQSVVVTLEAAKDPVRSVSDDIAISASSILKNARQEKLDRIGLIGWAIVGFGILTIGIFGFQNSICNRKSRRHRTAALSRHTCRKTKISRSGARLSSRVHTKAAYQRYGRNIEVRR